VTQNYFELFGLPPSFSIELATFETNFRKIQSASHPDRFVTGTAAEKLSTMQLATLANEAYQTLKSPANRAKYLLELQGITAISETNTAMPAAFLMRQMDWRESLDENEEDLSALEALTAEVEEAKSEVISEIAQAIDSAHQYERAAELLRGLLFIDKFAIELDDAIATLA